ASHLFVIAKADVTPHERRRVGAPPAVRFGDNLPLSIHPSAIAFSALEKQHRQPSAAEVGRRIDVGERCLERRQGGERTSCGRGSNLFASRLLVIAIVVGVIVVVIRFVIVTHARLLCWKASSAAANDRAISPRPRTGTRTFSLRTSDAPERCETMSSSGIFKPRALARSSICLGERRASSMMSLRARPSLISAPRAAFSSCQCRSARPAESA